MAEVGRPPVLAVGHQPDQIGLERLVIELLEGFGVVECFTQRIGSVGMLIEQINTQLIRPPIFVGRATTSDVVERTFTLVRHGSLLLLIGSVPASATDNGTSLDPLRQPNQFMKHNGAIVIFFHEPNTLRTTPENANSTQYALQRNKFRQQKTGHQARFLVQPATYSAASTEPPTGRSTSST